MPDFNFQKETDPDALRARKAISQEKRAAYKKPGDPAEDEYQRPDTAEYARRQYLLNQTALAPYLPPSLQTADRREDEMFSRFAATWMANTATSAALSLNTYLAADLRIAAAQNQTPTAFELFFSRPPAQDQTQLPVLQSRLNLINKVRETQGIKGAQFTLEKLAPLPQTLADRVASNVNYAQTELEHHPQALNQLTTSISEINEKTRTRETTELLRCVESETDRKRYPNGQTIFQQMQRLQQSEHAQSIRQETQYIELIQTRNNFQSWCSHKTGQQRPITLPNPHEEDLNYELKVRIANFLYNKLHEHAVAQRALDKSLQPQEFYNIPDQEFLRGIDWKTQGKTVHPNTQQLQMVRQALTSAATALKFSDPESFDQFLQFQDKNKNNTNLQEARESRAMQILWIAGAEAPCKLGSYKAANRKLQTDLHLAFEGNVLEKLIHLIKTNFRWFAQVQQLVMINRQLASIHRDMNPHQAAHQDQHASNLRSMPRL